MLMASTEASTRPMNTRMVVAATVIITDSKADGPSSAELPTCQRVAVLKNFPCSAKFERKMCGGGSSWGSAQPTAHRSSQMPANRPTDRQAHQTLPSQSMPAIAAKILAMGRLVTVGWATPAGLLGARHSVALMLFRTASVHAR